MVVIGDDEKRAAPSFTHFYQDIDNDVENGTPGIFQTFSLGATIHEIGAVRFAGEKKTVRCGNENEIQLVSEQICPLELQVCVRQRRTRRKHAPSVFFFRPFSPIEIRLDNGLPKFGVLPSR